MRESQIAKRVIIDDLKEKFERCASFVIIDYKGLTVEKDTEFRAESQIRRAEPVRKIMPAFVSVTRKVTDFVSFVSMTFKPS